MKRVICVIYQNDAVNYSMLQLPYIYIWQPQKKTNSDVLKQEVSLIGVLLKFI